MSTKTGRDTVYPVGSTGEVRVRLQGDVRGSPATRATHVFQEGPGSRQYVTDEVSGSASHSVLDPAPPVARLGGRRSTRDRPDLDAIVARGSGTGPI